MKSMVF